MILQYLLISCIIYLFIKQRDISISQIQRGNSYAYESKGHVTPGGNKDCIRLR